MSPPTVAPLRQRYDVSGVMTGPSTSGFGILAEDVAASTTDLEYSTHLSLSRVFQRQCAEINETGDGQEKGLGGRPISTLLVANLGFPKCRCQSEVRPSCTHSCRCESRCMFELHSWQHGPMLVTP